MSTFLLWQETAIHRLVCAQFPGCRKWRLRREGERRMVRLSEAEWKVMGALWEEAPQTIMQMTRRFQKTTGWTKHTIMTFLKRMEDKGAVRYEVGERAKLYYPQIERQEAALQETEEFLERVFDGRMGLMLNTMVQHRALSGEELSELHEILMRAEKGRRDAEGGQAVSEKEGGWI